MRKLEREYDKFEKAWNTFAGLTIKDDNVDVSIPKINKDTKVIYCCLTSSNIDQEGHIFYLLLKYLSTE